MAKMTSAANSVDGAPHLVVSTTSNYGFIYSDKGTGAHKDVTIYRPSPTDNSFFIVGDYAQENHGGAVGHSMIVKAVNDDPAKPMLAPPTGYLKIWDDKGTGGEYDGTIWQPIPPDGYVALGHVGGFGYNVPGIPNFMCVIKDLVTQTQAGTMIWNDKGSGAKGDVALWSVVGNFNLFIAQTNHNPAIETGIFFKLAHY